jgi:sirohydrochlorin cobaltochelatase
MTRPGLILFAHGARDPLWAKPFEAVAMQVRQSRPQLQLRLAFLEFMQPDLGTAARDLVQCGCSAVHVLPLFLGTGGHLRKDLPLLVEALRSVHPGVHFGLQAAAGEHEVVIRAMAQVALSTLPDTAVPPGTAP